MLKHLKIDRQYFRLSELNVPQVLKEAQNVNLSFTDTVYWSKINTSRRPK